MRFLGPRSKRNVCSKVAVVSVGLDNNPSISINSLIKITLHVHRMFRHAESFAGDASLFGEDFNLLVAR